MIRAIRVLLADDSAFARKVVREVLESEGMEVVGSARDGAEALEMAASLTPDLVISDLMMPRLSGPEFVAAQMAIRPLPILILSSATQDAPEVLEALNAGAIDVVRKPTALATDNLREVRAELVEKIRGTLSARPARLQARREAARPLAPAATARGTLKADVVVLGISTGGPQALRRLMPLFPKDFPVPFLIVLHMPIGYTSYYAEKLNESCAMQVKEAADGDVLRPGLVLLAQAGRHLTLQKEGNLVVARLTVHPLESLHRPSVDVLFQSAAAIYGARTLGVVMTGMGDDGKQGAAWIKSQGGQVLTEAESSCVIYGMPRSVAEAGLSDAAVPLEQMAVAITANL
jgi:two-component system chemotaxis response regulator CheB